MESSNPATVAAKAFHKKHGPECYHEGTYIYYADGSYRENSEWGVLWDCDVIDMRRPELEYQVFLNRLKFYQLKLGEAIAQFDELNTKLAHGWIPPEPDLELRKLEVLQGKVNECRTLVAAAEQALETETQWGRQRAAKRRSEAEAKQRLAEFQKRRQAIRI